MQWGSSKGALCSRIDGMTDPRDSSRLSYSSVELESYLPSGWSLEEPAGSFEPDEKQWRIAVQDVGEMISTLAVRLEDADRLGRIPALKAAIDKLYRRRSAKRWWG